MTASKIIAAVYVVLAVNPSLGIAADPDANSGQLIIEVVVPVDEKPTTKPSRSESIVQRVLIHEADPISIQSPSDFVGRTNDAVPNRQPFLDLSQASHPIFLLSPVRVQGDGTLASPAWTKPKQQDSKKTRPSNPFAFAPIGELNADVTIGKAGTDADVEPEDRPSEQMPLPETVFVAGVEPSRNWRPTSPMHSISLHQPLYFEDVNLERYGTSCNNCCQPIVSGARFCFDIASLPYQMTLQPPRMQYQYSHAFEAGRFCRQESQQLPVDCKASLFETAAILALIAIIP